MADLISTATVAARLEVTEATLCHWRKRGVGPDFIRHGRVCFYPSDMLEAYLSRVGPVPSREEDPERRFFTEIHNPRMTPERKVTLEDMLEALTARVENLEKALAKLEANTPKAKAARLRDTLRKSELAMAAKIAADEKRKRKSRPVAPIVPS